MVACAASSVIVESPCSAPLPAATPMSAGMPGAMVASCAVPVSLGASPESSLESQPSAASSAQSRMVSVVVRFMQPPVVWADASDAQHAPPLVFGDHADPCGDAGA